MTFSIRELAEKKGVKIYDTALPLKWYEDVHDRTGFWPQEYGFVWSYDNASLWGEPVALTPAAEILLAFYEEMDK